MCDGGIPGCFEGVVSSALRHLVRTAADREKRNAAPAKCHSHNRRNWVASEKGTAANEEGSNRLPQRGSLDPRVQDAKWCCGNPVDEARVGSVPESNRDLWERRVP